MNKTTKINILAYVSDPDKTYNYYGDIVTYEGKRYFVSLAEERVEFLGIVNELKLRNDEEKCSSCDGTGLKMWAYPKHKVDICFICNGAGKVKV